MQWRLPMSVKAMTWVWDHSPTAGTERLVLLAIADTADDEGGNAWPAISTLARKTRLDVRTVQRVIRRLVTAGQLRVKTAAGRAGTNVYTLVLDPPADGVSASAGAPTTAGPTLRQAATPGDPPGVAPAPPSPRHGRHPSPGARATRTSLNVLEPPPPPSPPARACPRPDRTEEAAQVEEEPARRRRELLAAAGVDDLDALTERVQRAREALGRPTVRWSVPCLLDALDRAVHGRGWPAAQAGAALLAVAADPASKGPMRLAEAGPWWDQPAASGHTGRPVVDDAELLELEDRLAGTGGQRVRLQQRAREQLAGEGLPVTRLTVARRACELLVAS